MKSTLHLLMGLPGAGKSTLSRVLHELTDAHILSSDDMRKKIFIKPCFSQDEHDKLYEILDHNLEHLLEAGKDAIYDANLNRRIHRDEKYELAGNLDARVILWWVDVPKALAKQRRMSEQDHALLPEGETSERMFERIALVLEEPTADEPCIKVDGTKISKSYIKELLANFY
ncbi:MAG TPA: ATP-binding protein [Candidatus Saccharibacteria bacterium]|jgi:predicted kinase|nr:ATP-binding protein [Candidatus Saccharibacteria bacterium]HMT56023.1 ATP-binding protein [Candidatus Saccharibacteria bacterium]